MLLQKLAAELKKFPTTGPEHARQGGRGERGRHRHRRRLGGRVQDRSRTIIRARSSRSKARPPASAGSFATFSRWARGRCFSLNSLRFGPITGDISRTSKTQSPAFSPAWSRHRALRQLHRHPDDRRRNLFRRKLRRQSAGECLLSRRACGTSKSRAARPRASAIRFFTSARRPGATVWPARRLRRAS